MKKKPIGSLNEVSIGDTILYDNNSLESLGITKDLPYRVIENTMNNYSDGEIVSYVFFINDRGRRIAVGEHSISSWYLIENSLTDDDKYLEGLME